jgi:hypothetical protein
VVGTNEISSSLATSRSSSKSSQNSRERSPDKEKKHSTPEPHTSKDYSREEVSTSNYYSSKYRSVCCLSVVAPSDWFLQSEPFKFTQNHLQNSSTKSIGLQVE